jgi:membrane fusion protein, multidrug efflux system
MDRFINVKTLAFPLLCIAILTGCEQAQEQTKEDKFAVPVETALVGQGHVSSFYSTTATLEAPEEAHVLSRVSGLVEKILVEEGDRVTKGQVLAVIDPKRQKYELNRAEAEVQIVEQELNRLKKINNKEFVSQDALAKLEFNLQAAKAQRDLAELKLKDSQITSPINGVVAHRLVKLGNMAKEFDELFYIVNQDELHGIVHLPEQQLASLRLGQEAKIFSQQSQQDVIAHVLRISPVVDASSGTFKVTLAVPNHKAQLKSGMFTRVELKYDTHDNAITVPYNAVINQDNILALYIIKDDKALRREVSLGYRENEIVEVIHGVEPGEQVVIRGQQNLKDQSLVEVITPLNFAAK